jgi:transposase
MLDLTGQVAELHRLTRTDPDPRVRHRADALLLLAHGRSVDEAAHDMGCCTKRIRVWRRRFLAEGRQGLADRPRQGRPLKLDAQAQAICSRSAAGRSVGRPSRAGSRRWAIATVARAMI